MSNKNRNYTNYSKPNKPAETHEEKVQETTEASITTPEPTPPAAVTGVVINCEKLNIRAEATTDAKILGTFFKGQEIELYLDTSTDDFYDVSVGFCMKKYIKLNK